MEAGFDVWFDQFELYPGDNLYSKIGAALHSADAMIVLISPDSMKSRWVIGEIQYAIGSTRFAGRVIPVIVKPAYEIPLILRQFHMIDADNDPDRVVRMIATALRSQETGELVDLLTAGGNNDAAPAQEGGRLASVIPWFTQGLISQGKAAEIAGIGLSDFLTALGRAKVDAFQISETELKREVERGLEAYRERLAVHIPDSVGTARHSE